MYFLGVDCGTQGTKVIVFDSDSGQIMSKGYATHPINIGDDGKREQKAEWWIDALIKATHSAIEKSGIAGKQIKAMSVSGQQHGLVLLDDDGNVLRDVKLWNDTSTASDNDYIVDQLGGMAKVWEMIGTTLPVGYTASKVRHILANEPSLFEKVKHIILPHDYINFYLTGKYCTDVSEASGTGYYDVNSRSYSQEMMHIIDPTGVLKAAVPPIISWHKPAGTILPEVAELLGLSDDVLVGIGGGDNSMGAVGTSAIGEGRCAISLGTSGTVSLPSAEPGVGTDPLVQLYNIMDSKWLATICTLNATNASTSIQKLFNVEIGEFDEKMAQAPIGCEGVRVVPFFGGERMPPLPQAKGFIKNLTSLNTTQENIIRATAEAVIFTLKWGFDKLVTTYSKPKSMIITGGGSNSKPWRQIVADVFDLPVYCLESDEGGAFGAALQAMYMYQSEQGDDTSLFELCDTYVKIDNTKDTHPIKENVALYEEVYTSYMREISKEWAIEV